MPELRQNRLTKEWVIIATERAKRPEELKVKRELKPLPAYVQCGLGMYPKCQATSLENCGIGTA